MPPAKLSLDIGVASGGQTKFLRDYYPAEKTIVVDIGQHPQFVHWPRIKRQINSELILEIIEDSHAPEVAKKLAPFARQVDFAFVDGDHSYRGLRKDIFLVRELLAPGGYMVLHDTLAVHDCRRVHEELLAPRENSALCATSHCGSEFRSGGWPRRAPPLRSIAVSASGGSSWRR